MNWVDCVMAKNGVLVVVLLKVVLLGEALVPTRALIILMQISWELAIWS